MPFIRRHEIGVQIRGNYDEAHKRQLRRALLNPNLDEAQHRYIRDQLATVGHAKKYDAKAPPKVGAVVLDPKASPPPSKLEQDREQLESRKRPELVQMVRDRGLPVSGTKAQLIDRLLGQ